MKVLNILAVGAFLVSTNAFAGRVVPEFLYQPDAKSTAVENGIAYSDASESSLNLDELTGNLSFMHGLTHGLALRLGVSNTMADDSNRGGDGFNNIELDLIAHRGIGFSSILHYGIEGRITPSKTPGDQRFSTFHSFNPYLGLSRGERYQYGVKLSYDGLRTSSQAPGGVTGNDYVASLFIEKNKEESHLLGFSVDYQQVSGKDDLVTGSLYGRLYLEKGTLFSFVPKLTLLPRLSYTDNMQDSDLSSYSVGIAARAWL